MLFILETDEKGFMDDFVNEVRLLIEQRNWFYSEEKPYIYITKNISSLTENDLKAGIPVGSVDFVSEFVRFQTKREIIPINIPKELNKEEFLKRKVWNVEYNEIEDILFSHERLFIKPGENIKKFDAFIIENVEKNKFYWKSILSPETKVIASEYVDIVSEWRFFVNNKKIVDMRPYSWTDAPLLPDINLVKKMINLYTEAPPAYTIDVGVVDKGDTILIEIHNFLACGLYGSDSINIPIMIFKAYQWELNRKEGEHICQNFFA